MKAVILCGGQGTRIRDVADDIPKPMIRIGDRPILWHIMRTYGAAGINDFVLCLGYKSWAIKEYFLNLRAQLENGSLQQSERLLELRREHHVLRHLLRQIQALCH